MKFTVIDEKFQLTGFYGFTFEVLFVKVGVENVKRKIFISFRKIDTFVVKLNLVKF